MGRYEGEYKWSFPLIFLQISVYIFVLYLNHLNCNYVEIETFTEINNLNCVKSVFDFDLYAFFALFSHPCAV